MGYGMWVHIDVRSANSRGHRKRHECGDADVVLFLRESARGDDVVLFIHEHVGCTSEAYAFCSLFKRVTLDVVLIILTIAKRARGRWHEKVPAFLKLAQPLE
jgi:hypothetical protein